MFHSTPLYRTEPMAETYIDLPDWTFEVIDTGPERCCVIARSKRGQEARFYGSEPLAVLDNATQEAMRLDSMPPAAYSRPEIISENRRFADLPQWTFSVEKTGLNVFVVTGQCRTGGRITLTGDVEESLMNLAREHARHFVGVAHG
jgi:hypothetical protein